MARTGITYDMVAEAAEALKIEGITVTQRSVRERLGTGSMGTIGDLLRTWNSQQPPKTEPVVNTTLSPTIATAIEGEIVKRVDAVISTKNAEIKALTDNNDAWDMENKALREEISDLTAQVQELEGECQRREGERRTQAEYIHKLEAELVTERNQRIEAEKEAAHHKALTEVLKSAPPAQLAPSVAHPEPVADPEPEATLEEAPEEPVAPPKKKPGRKKSTA